MEKEKQKKTRGKTRRWNLNYNYINNQKDKKQTGDDRFSPVLPKSSALGLSASPSDKELKCKACKKITKDFICIECMDRTIFYYEQEARKELIEEFEETINKMQGNESFPQFIMKGKLIKQLQKLKEEK